MKQNTNLGGILFGKCRVKIDHRKRNKKLEKQYNSILKYNRLNLDAYSLPMNTDELCSESLKS